MATKPSAIVPGPGSQPADQMAQAVEPSAPTKPGILSPINYRHPAKPPISHANTNPAELL